MTQQEGKLQGEKAEAITLVGKITGTGIRNAVLYTAQSLTEAQKAQARANIGVLQPDYTQNDSTKPDYIKNRPGGYLGEQKTYKLDISAVKQDGIDELTDVSVLQDDFMHMSSINVEISHSSGTINRTLTQREIGQYIINQYGAQIYGNAHLINPSQPDTGEDMALYKEMDSQSNYSIGWHVWATSVPSGDVEVCVVEKTMNAVLFDPVFIPWDTSPTAKSVLYTAQTLTDAQKEQARANIGAGTPYTLPEASSDALGGIKADAAETADTQPVRIGEDGKLCTAPGGGGADISLGISGASAGQMAKVKAVDESGAPTAWEAGDAAGGYSGYGNRNPDYTYTVTEVISELYISEINGNTFSANKLACLVEFPAGTGGLYYHALYTLQGSKDKNYCISNHNPPKLSNISTKDSAVFFIVEKLNNQNYKYNYSGQCKAREQLLDGSYGTYAAGIFPNSIEGETSIKSILLKGENAFGVGVKISIWLN